MFECERDNRRIGKSVWENVWESDIKREKERMLK